MGFLFTSSRHKNRGRILQYAKIRNWSKWQTYRADRGQPPWIKIHRRLLRDDQWCELTDVQRAHLVSIWLLAADRDGEIPTSPRLIKKLCFLDSEPDLQALVDAGFIENWRQGDVKVTPTWRQGDAPESESEAVQKQDRSRKEEGTQSRAKESGKPSAPSSKSDDQSIQDAKKVLQHLNRATGRNFGRWQNIHNCIKREKCTVDECIAVINFKTNEFRDKPDLLKSIVNQTTPWRPIHFQDYLDQSRAGSGLARIVDTRPRDDWGQPIPEWKIKMQNDIEEERKKMYPDERSKDESAN